MEVREKYIRPEKWDKRIVISTVNNGEIELDEDTLFELVKFLFFFSFLRSTDGGTNAFHHFGLHLRISQSFGTLVTQIEGWGKVYKKCKDLGLRLQFFRRFLSFHFMYTIVITKSFIWFQHISIESDYLIVNNKWTLSVINAPIADITNLFPDFVSRKFGFSNWNWLGRGQRVDMFDCTLLINLFPLNMDEYVLFF